MEILYASLTVVLFVYLLRYVKNACARSLPPRWAVHDTVPLLAALLLTVMLTVAVALGILGVVHFTSSSLVSETIAIASVILMVLAIFAPQLLFGRRRSTPSASDASAGATPLVPGLPETR